MRKHRRFVQTIHEPIFNPTAENEMHHIASIFNYYSNNKSNDEATKYLVGFLTKENYSDEQIRYLEKAKDKEKLISNTVCWIARMCCLSDNIPEKYKQHLLTNIEKNLKMYEEEKNIKQPIKKLGVKERIENQVNEYISNIETILDDPEQIGSIDIENFLKSNNVGAIQAKKLSEYFEEVRLKELLVAYKKTDPELVEAYSHLSRKTLKLHVDILLQIVNTTKEWYNKAKNISIQTRKPRKKKEKDINLLVKKIKYQHECSEYNCISIEPKNLIGSSQLWVFNTKTRSLGVYVCSNLHGLSVKGTTIQNFDNKESSSKKIRDPKEVLPRVLSGGKLFCKNIFDNIKAKNKILNGRLNSDTILLRAI